MGYQEFEPDGKHRSLNVIEQAQLAFDGFVGLRHSRKLILLIVFIALFLDNMLLTTVVPIVPDFLWYLKTNDVNYTEQCIELSRNESVKRWHNQYLNMSHSDTINWISSHHKHQSSQLKPVSGVYSRYGILSQDPIDVLNPDVRQEDARVVNASEIYRCLRESESWRHNILLEMNVEVGLMFAAKSVMQLITNPFIGPLTNRIGYSIPMFSGFVIMFISTIIFAFGESYGVLFVARAIQGIGSACSSVSGLGMLATQYPDDRERGHAMSIALGGLALGVLVGPPFGGTMYQYVNKEAPFLMLAALAVIDGALQLLVLKPHVKQEAQEGAALKELLRDPYILLAAGSITFGNMGIAMLEPSLPIWMKEKMHARKVEQGLAFLPCSISYLIGTNIFGPLAFKIGRWLSAGMGMVLMGICLIAIPFAQTLGHLIVPNFGLGFAIGMVDSSMMPIMGYLVDLRHVSVYGSVYAIADIAFCLGFAIGPALSGSIVKAIKFKGMMWAIAVIAFLYSPLHYFLKNPPPAAENTGLVMNSSKPIEYQSQAQNIDNKSAGDEGTPLYQQTTGGGVNDGQTLPP